MNNIRDFDYDRQIQPRPNQRKARKRRRNVFLLLGFLAAFIVGWMVAPKVLNKLQDDSNPLKSVITHTKGSIPSAAPGKGNDTLAGSADSDGTGLQGLVQQYSEVQTIIDQKNQYPAELLELLIRNPETLHFVLDYPANGSQNVNSADISSDLQQGKIPVFQQWDERWGYSKYGDGMIALTGCGPTSLSMVASGLTGNISYDPLSIAKFADENGYYVVGSGSSWDLMTGGASKLGLTATELPLDENRMVRELNAKHPIICSMHPGDFTTSGHFIVLVGVASNGEFIIHDPNSIARSNETWSYSRLSPQIANLWSYSYDKALGKRATNLEKNKK